MGRNESEEADPRMSAGANDTNTRRGQNGERFRSPAPNDIDAPQEGVGRGWNESGSGEEPGPLLVVGGGGLTGGVVE